MARVLDVPIEDLRERARTLRAEALALLDGGLGVVLRDELGTVEIAGSVALDLMAWRDIDLYTRLEAGDVSRLVAALPRLAAALASQGQPLSRVFFRDEHLEPDPAFPDMPGLYLGLVTTGGWKIDLWGWDAGRVADQQRRHRELAESMKRADRDLVLRVKDAVHGRPGYRSTDVYEFALADAGTSLEDFERFRRQSVV
jgi:hypothetical protein